MKLFITGTDTEIGKTYVSVGLLKALNRQNLSTLSLKPVSSGCVLKNGTWMNEDAELLRTHSSVQLSYEQINPFAFEPAIAPHIAAKLNNTELTVSQLIQKSQTALKTPADVCVIEGVGGWYCPLNKTQTMADFVKAMQFKTILVVGIRLGCLSHALLTYSAILKDNVPLIGWVANCVDHNMLYRAENIATLQNSLNVPCLGVIDYLQPPEEALVIQGLLPHT